MAVPSSVRQLKQRHRDGLKAAGAAYIDLNPVRAKIVAEPKDYRWSGYGEACGGGKLARAGLIEVHDSRL